MGLHAVGNALQFPLIFSVDVRPENFPSGLAKEIPIALGLVGVEELDRFEGIGNFRSEQIAVLEADVGRRAFEVDIGPTALLEAVSVFEAGIGGLCQGQGGRYGGCTKRQKYYSPIKTAGFFSHGGPLLSKAGIGRTAFLPLGASGPGFWRVKHLLV